MEHSRKRSESAATLVKLPVGYRFLPTDEELVAFYLRNKVLELPLPDAHIRDIDCKDLYGSPPSNMVRVSSSDDREWYFFVRCDKNFYETSTRTVGDGIGVWKGYNTDEISVLIRNFHNLRATKNYFTYFTRGEDTKLRKTHWEMEEYRLHNFSRTMEEGDHNERQKEWVLVRIKRRGYYNNSLL